MVGPHNMGRPVMDRDTVRDGVEGSFPNNEQLIPTEFATVAHLDTVEAGKAIASLKAISDNPKSYAIDLTIGDGRIVMANPDEKGDTVIPADTDGQCYVRVDGAYLTDVLKACGSMVDFKLTNAYSPMLFTADGYQVVVMPMVTDKAKEQREQDIEARRAKAEAQAVADVKAKAETKPKRSRKREPVAVA